MTTFLCIISADPVSLSKMLVCAMNSYWPHLSEKDPFNEAWANSGIKKFARINDVAATSYARVGRDWSCFNGALAFSMSWGAIEDGAAERLWLHGSPGAHLGGCRGGHFCDMGEVLKRPCVEILALD